MGTLYIDRKELYISLDGNALAFYVNGQREGVVPINPLKRVVIVGKVTIETPVLHRLAGENISVVFLSGKRLKFNGVLQGRMHNNGQLRVTQYKNSLTGFALEVSKELVERKIQKQLGLLAETREGRPDLRLKLTTAMNTLEEVSGKVRGMQGDLNSLRGLEGGAAASYFSAFVCMFPDSLGFERRNRRPPVDPVNAMLSLCYTMLHYEMCREIEVIGLDPTIGLYHQFDYGRESLACDLVEPYRPDVDRLVWEMFRSRMFTARDFSRDDERPGCYLKKQSRAAFYPAYEAWAKEMRPLWVEEVRSLAGRIMYGQDTLSE